MTETGEPQPPPKKSKPKMWVPPALVKPSEETARKVKPDKSHSPLSRLLTDPESVAKKAQDLLDKLEEKK